MDYYRNPKVVGAFLIGFALVGGAYTIANFGKTGAQGSAQLQAIVAEAPVRVFIPVTDTNTDGVEDWRDQFVQAPAVDLTALKVADYTPPTTLTGQIGVSLMEDLIKMKAGGPVAATEEAIVGETIETLSKTAAKDTLYDVRDVIVAPSRSVDTIRAYGNALAQIILEYNASQIKNELALLNEHLNQGNAAALADLEKLATTYKNYRDNTLITPVPEPFLKQHLDLINVYNAIYNDIAAMAKTDADPLVTLVRLKRYEEDAEGLAIAITNMYESLTPYANVFLADDPAIMFVKFYQLGP
jgi:hypothetical protein